MRTGSLTWSCERAPKFAYLDVGAVGHPDLLEAPEGLADGALVVVGEGGTGVAKVVRDADCQGQSGRKCECHGNVESWLESRLVTFKIRNRELTCIL